MQCAVQCRCETRAYHHMSRKSEWCEKTTRFVELSRCKLYVKLTSVMASRAASLLRSSRLQASVRSVLSMRSAQKISSACTSQQIRFQSGTIPKVVILFLSFSMTWHALWLVSFLFCNSTPGEASSELVEILKKELAGEQSSAAEAPAVPAGWSMKVLLLVHMHKIHNFEKYYQCCRY